MTAGADAPAPPRPPDTRRWALEAAGVGLLIAVVHVVFRLSTSFLVGALNDDGVYVALGKAIAQGDGYRSIHLVGAPLQLKYPPGFPLLLAAPWALGGTLDAVRGAVAVLHPLVVAAGAGLVWWSGRRWLGLSPWPLAVCAVGPFVLDPVIQYFSIPLTEPYLVTGWAGALALAAPLAAPPATAPASAGRPRLGQAAALGLVVAATTLFRTLGVALIPAVLGALALHRRWKELAACAVALLTPLVVWQALQAYWMTQAPVSTQPDDLSYLRWLGVATPAAFVWQAAQAVAANGVEYVRKLAGYLFPNQVVGIAAVLGALVAAAAACARLWRSHAPLVLTTLCSTALTLAWPYAQGRLLLPLLPFLGLLVASTADRGLRRASARLRWAPPVALGLVFAVVTLRQFELRRAAVRAYETGVLPPPQDLSPALTLALRSRFIYHVSRWIEGHAAPDDRVLVDAPAAVYLYTGRRTVVAMPPETRHGPSVYAVPGRFLAGRVLADSVSLVVWAPPAPGLERDLETIKRRCPAVLREESPGVALYFRVQRDERCLRELVLAGDGAP